MFFSHVYSNFELLYKKLMFLVRHVFLLTIKLGNVSIVNIVRAYIFVLGRVEVSITPIIHVHTHRLIVSVVWGNICVWLCLHRIVDIVWLPDRASIGNVPVEYILHHRVRLLVCIDYLKIVLISIWEILFNISRKKLIVLVRMHQ